MRTFLLLPVVLGVGLLASLGSADFHFEISAGPQSAPPIEPNLQILTRETEPQNEGCSSACAGDKDETCCYNQCVCASDPDERARERACRAYDKMHCAGKR